jgi:hypothetical protein
VNRINSHWWEILKKGINIGKLLSIQHNVFCLHTFLISFENCSLISPLWKGSGNEGHKILRLHSVIDRFVKVIYSMTDCSHRIICKPVFPIFKWSIPIITIINFSSYHSQEIVLDDRFIKRRIYCTH